MITIFSIPKPFKGHIETIQTNAIRSWLKLRPSCQIILFGDDEGVAETAEEVGVQHSPHVERNEFGTPLLDHVFRKAHELAEHDTLCYVNGDIILMSDFLQAVAQIRKRHFLIVGQRWDVDLEEEWDFSTSDWEMRLRTYIMEAGRIHPPTGMDYFVFPRGQYRDIPPFAVGRPGWDNWMVYYARSCRIPVINATEVVTAVHENHDYAHHPDGRAGIRKGAEAKRNLELVEVGDTHIFTLRDATWSLTSRSLKPALTSEYLRRRLLSLPVLYPRLCFGIILARALSGKLRSALRRVRT